MMRLINATTLELEDFTLKPKPKYAILSHTWDVDEEVSYQEMLSKSSASKKGWDKIRNTCKLALRKRLSYVWVDTCCIDKTNSTELSEAINSMFAWYQEAEECFAFLSDISLDNDNQIKDCRWWTRGWTLQELIAPRHLTFFDADWVFVSSKETECDMIAEQTNIPVDVLCHTRHLSTISAAAKMYWASHRSTTRKEDEAYCLLGLFNISMPLIYGEGAKAFRRLQEEIINRTDDLSILAGDGHQRLLADSPRAFASCANVEMTPEWNHLIQEHAISNVGLKLSGRVALDIITYKYPGSDFKSQFYALELGARSPLANNNEWLLCLRKLGPNAFEKHPDFSGALCYKTFPRPGFVIMEDITIVDKSHGDGRRPRHEYHYTDAHIVHIPESDVFELKGVRPQLLWDIERRRLISGIPAIEPFFTDSVYLALLQVNLKSTCVHVLVYWRKYFIPESGLWKRHIRILSVSSPESKIPIDTMIQYCNQLHGVSMDDLSSRLDIKDCSSKITIQHEESLATIRARLIPQTVKGSYDLHLQIHYHVADQETESVDQLKTAELSLRSRTEFNEPTV